MKKWLIIFLSFITIQAFGQNDIIFSHYMLNPAFQNPAFIGMGDKSFISFQLRSQWTGYAATFDGSGGAPNTQSLTFSVPVVGQISGLGLIAVNDNLGPVNNIIFNLPVSYDVAVGYGTITLGLQPGVYSQIQKFDELRFNDPGDPFNVGSRESQTKFNLSLGALLTTRNKIYVAISSANLLEPSFDYGLDSLENKLVRNYGVIAGFERQLFRNITINPSLNFRTELNTFTFDIGAMLKFGDDGWAGLSYRWAEAMVFMFGYSFLPGNKLQVGYALDYVVDEQEAKQPTSQELFLRYNLPDFMLGGRKKVKTPRFTY